jgi:hypothetical protein
VPARDRHDLWVHQDFVGSVEPGQATVQQPEAAHRGESGLVEQHAKGRPGAQLQVQPSIGCHLAQIDAGRTRRRDHAGEPVDGVGVRTRAPDTELFRVSRYRDVGSGARSQRPRQRRPATTSIGGGAQSQARHQPTDDAKTHPRTPAPAKADPIAIADAAHHPMVPAAGSSSKDASCRLPERLAPPSNSDGRRGVFVVRI